MSIIMKCSCKHEFQDKQYGPGMRVHNVSESKKEAYCTVCSPSHRKNKQGVTAFAKDNKVFGMLVDNPAREGRKGKKI